MRTKYGRRVFYYRTSWQKQVRDRLEIVLHGLFEHQNERPVVFVSSGYKIKPKNANENARIQRLLTFEGPDRETLELLSSKAEQWLENPSSFWNQETVNENYQFRPEVHLVHVFRRTMRLDT